MSESQMYKFLRQKTEGVIHWERITERLRKGVADTVWTSRPAACTGWCELKYLPHMGWNEQLTIPDLRNEQILFLSTQTAAQARASVLLRIGASDVWMLFDVPANPVEAIALLKRPNPTPTLSWKGFPGAAALEWGLVYMEPRPAQAPLLRSFDLPPRQAAGHG